MKKIVFTILTFLSLTAFAQQSVEPTKQIQAYHNLTIVDEYQEPNIVSKEKPYLYESVAFSSEPNTHVVVSFDVPIEFNDKDVWDISLNIDTKSSNKFESFSNISFKRTVNPNGKDFNIIVDVKSLPINGYWNSTLTLIAKYIGKKETHTAKFNVYTAVFPHAQSNAVVFDGIPNAVIEGKNVTSVKQKNGDYKIDITIDNSVESYLLDNINLNTKKIIDLLDSRSTNKPL